MSHFAEVVNGVVVRVIVAEQDFIDSGAVGTPSNWLQTSYNTTGGEHKEGGVPLRKNFAGVGYTYQKDIDAFVPPKPFPSWEVSKDTGLWEAPIPMPAETAETVHAWNEADQAWEPKTRTVANE